MRFEELILTGFGRFQGQRIELKPGLNIIYGQNEAGKSTLQRFLLGMLYGFKKRAQRREYTGDAERYRPWAGGEYRGALVYCLERSGRSFRVERNFDPKREAVRVYDALTGADLSGRFQTDRRKELLFADEHFGLTEEVFRSTAWIGQMEVGRLEMGRELVARVANMQESGREDLSVRSALDILEEQAKEIGTERAATRPYGRVLRQLDEKRQLKERAVAAREQTMAWEAQLSETRAVLAELDAELSAVNGRLDWALLREARAQLERISTGSEGMRAARARVAGLARYACFPAHFRDRLVTLQARRKAAAEEADRLAGRLAETEGELASIRERLAGKKGLAESGQAIAAELELIQQLAAAAGESVPALEEEAVRLQERLARLDEALEPLRPAAEKGSSVLARVEELERELAELRPRLDIQAPERLRVEVSRLDRELRAVSGRGWLIGTVSAVLCGLLPFGFRHLFSGPVLIAAVGSAALVAAGCALMHFFTQKKARLLRLELELASDRLDSAHQRFTQAQQEMEELEREKDRALSVLGVGTAGEVRNRVIRFEQLTARREGQRLRLETVRTDLQRAGTDLTRRREVVCAAIAGALGHESELDFEPAAFQFNQAYAEFEALGHEQETLARTAADLARREQEERAAAEALAVSIRELYDSAGVPGQAEFEAACAGREAYEQALAEAKGLEGGLSGLLGGETEEALAARVAELEARVSGSDPGTTGTSDLLQAESRRLESRRSELMARQSDLAARVETALQELPDLADLTRELRALDEERAGYDRELEALALARQVMGEVSDEIHREFAPRLNEAMGRLVSGLTGGRYETVRIDENLGIRAIDGSHRTVDLLALSAGTADQFYFGLREAVLDLITAGQEPIPLMLDDPFVQYDDDRLQRAIEHLAGLSGSRQVLLMTCHRREVRAAEAIGAPVHLINLSQTGV